MKSWKLRVSCARPRFATYRRVGLGLTAILFGLASLASPVHAQSAAGAATTMSADQTADASQAPSAPAPTLSLQLNKLVPHGQNCQAFMVIQNKSADRYETLKIELIEFGTDGIIDHRFAVDLAPIPPHKELVKGYNIASPCDQIGSFLVNDVMQCKTATGSPSDCLSRLALSSRTKAQLTK